MKKYYLADILSALEVALTLVIIALTIVGAPANIVIWVFCVAELCDAFDGPCARRWPYPEDDKTRWWRKHVKFIEHASDATLLIAIGIFITATLIIRYNDFVKARMIVNLAISLACLCVAVELATINNTLHRKLVTIFILLRRLMYVLTIVYAILQLIALTTWPLLWKTYAVIAGVIIGILLVAFKLKRFFQTD